MKVPSRYRMSLLMVVALVALPIVATPDALAAETSAQREGQRLLRSIESGSRDCSELSTGDFEAIGEYVMGRMAGSASAHEQMEDLMRTMMGTGSEKQMHVFMGRRFSECAGGTIPGGLGGMMGLMGMMGGGFGQGGDGPGYGSMMGSLRADSSDDGWSGAAIVMTIFMWLLVAAAAAALLLWRPRRVDPRARSALDLLDQRYAHGDIDQEDYERRRQALGGA